MLDFVKRMYEGKCPIDGYLAAGVITQEQFDEITSAEVTS